MQDRDLRASLEHIGPQIPGLEYAGELIDGRKKALMCAELHITFPIYAAKTLEEACSILWTRHPGRALELAGPKNILELAALCSTSAVAIAKELKANQPKKTKARQQRLTDTPIKMSRSRSAFIRRLFVIEPELYLYAKEAAAQRGHKNVSRVVRDALWKEIAIVVPNAPQFQPRRIQIGQGNSRANRRRAR